MKRTCLCASALVFAFHGLLPACEQTEPSTSAQDENVANESPVDVVKRCLSSLATGELEAYVDCLADEEVDYQSGLHVVSTSMMAYFKQFGAQPNDPQALLLFNNTEDLLEQHTVHADTGNQDAEAAKALSGFVQRALQGAQQSADRTQYARAAGILRDRRAFLKDYMQLLVDAGLFAPSAPGQGPADGPGLADLMESEWHSQQLRDHAVVWSTPRAANGGTENAAAAVQSEQSDADAKQGAAKPHNIELRRIGERWKITKLMVVGPKVKPAAQPNETGDE